VTASMLLLTSSLAFGGDPGCGTPCIAPCDPCGPRVRLFAKIRAKLASLKPSAHFTPACCGGGPATIGAAAPIGSIPTPIAGCAPSVGTIGAPIEAPITMPTAPPVTTPPVTMPPKEEPKKEEPKKEEPKKEEPKKEEPKKEAPKDLSIDLPKLPIPGLNGGKN